MRSVLLSESGYPDMAASDTPPVSQIARQKIVHLLAKELSVGSQQVSAAVALLDEAATVPFVARYRKK